MGPFEEVDKGLVDQGDIENAREVASGEGLRVVSRSESGPPGGFNVCLVKIGGKDKKKKDKEKKDEGRVASRKFLDQTADIPMDVLMTVPRDGLYKLSIMGVLKVADSGGGSLNGQLSYTEPPTGGSGTIYASVSMASLGSPNGEDTLVWLLGGTPITFFCTGGTYAEGGKYCFAVAAERVA